MVEIAPAIDKLPVEKITPINGVIRVVPQVGQPAPSAINPVMMPAFSRLAAFWSFFFFQSKTIRPIRVPCRMAMKKIGSQSRKGWFIPKMAKKLSPMILRPLGKPSTLINSNLARPAFNKFMSKPKRRKLGIKPYQKRFSLVASKIPFAANTKPSSHFLQFINTIIAQLL